MELLHILMQAETFLWQQAYQVVDWKENSMLDRIKL